ncbi:type III restriction endonuclease subunit R [Streptomyces sp. NPDC046716]|uniref:type III restriction endonuclease subunit R n=1 Tax=Streptomyces sp. NPDC046716 TaxID=3157093 RepID=UPI0033CF15E7
MKAASRLTPTRAGALTSLAPDWQLPHGPDWHRKYHLLRAHVEAGNHPSTLTRDTVIHGVNAGSWLRRQFSIWARLAPGQRDMLTRIGLTPDRITLDQGSAGRSPATRRRTFAQTAEILKLFVERWERIPGAREWIDVDGERIMIGPWLAKTRTKLNAGQLPHSQAELLEQIIADYSLAPNSPTLTEPENLSSPQRKGQEKQNSNTPKFSAQGSRQIAGMINV